MLQSAIDLILTHPIATTSSGFGALLASEIIGFTKHGGLFKGLLDLLIALGRAAAEFKRARSEGQPPQGTNTP